MAGAALSEVIYSSVKPIIRMYLIIGSGIVMARVGLLGVATARALSDLVLMVFMPSLIFDKIVNYISIDDIKTIAVIVLSAILMYCINAVVAGLIVIFTPVPKKKDQRWVGGALLAGIMQNVSDLPIAYLQAMSMLTSEESEKGTAYVIIWLAMYIMAQFNCGLFQLVEMDFRYIRKHSDDKDEDIESQGTEDLSKTHSSSEKYAAESGDSIQKVDTNTPKQGNSSSSNLKSFSPNSEAALKLKVDEPAENEKAGEELEAQSHTTGAQRQAEEASSLSDSILNPMSPTSTLSENASLESDATGPDRRRSILNPRAILKKTTTEAEQLLSPAVSHRAIARIPSARSFTYMDRKNTIDEELNPVSMYDEDIRSTHSRATQATSLAEDLVREYSRAEPHNQNTSTLANIVTETQLSHRDVDNVAKKLSLAERYKIVKYVLFFVENFKKPASISLIVSLIIALIPWLKALFVNSGSVYISNAPDHQPALSFLLMYAEYLGMPCVPLGLLLIGSILGRLEVSEMPKGFWKSIVCHVLYRLCILPIIGILWVNKMGAIHWLDDSMSKLVTCMEFALPSATVQIYITASCMKPGENKSAPMNCLALYMIVQYALLCITLPIVVCYTIKDVVHM